MALHYDQHQFHSNSILCECNNFLQGIYSKCIMEIHEIWELDILWYMPWLLMRSFPLSLLNVQSQQNLVDHLTKELARDSISNLAIMMDLRPI